VYRKTQEFRFSHSEPQKFAMKDSESEDPMALQVIHEFWNIEAEPLFRSIPGFHDNILLLRDVPEHPHKVATVTTVRIQPKMWQAQVALFIQVILSRRKLPVSEWNSPDFRDNLAPSLARIR
jgi:hypothetical protein